MTVENVLDESPAASVKYGVSIVANGTPVFSHATFTHRWLTRWRRTLGIGLGESDVTHDFASAIAARHASRFWNGVEANRLRA